MAEQYFANKDKDMMAPKAKKASKGAVKKVFVLPRKGQKEYEDVERTGRKIKRTIEVPMKTKDIFMTKAKRVYSKGEKAILSKVEKKLQGLIKKRAERSEARSTKPLTLEEKNIKEQLEEKLKEGIEEAKSPEQKKMEKQVLLALEAPVGMMGIEAPKGKAGRPIQYTEPPEMDGEVETKYSFKSLNELKGIATDRGISKNGKKTDIIKRLIQDDITTRNTPYSKKALKMSALQESEEEESEDEPIVNAVAEVVAEITGSPEVKEQAATKIQTAFRGMIAKRKLASLKAEETEGQKMVKTPYINYILSKTSDFNENQLNKMTVSQLEAIIENDFKKPITGKGFGGITLSSRLSGLNNRALAGSGLGARGLGAILHGLNKIPNYKKDTTVKGGILGFIKGLATKAINHIAKDPIGALKQAVNIGKQAYEHGSKAKEMYDKFFKGKEKGGMLYGFTEPEKRQMVHKIYHLNLFNKAMEA
jgi:hypothetical protein